MQTFGTIISQMGSDGKVIPIKVEKSTSIFTVEASVNNFR